MAEYQATAPVKEDIRFDDTEFNVALEPKSAHAWLNLLEESEDVFEDWHDHCDNIEKRYANMERLADMSRPKEFQMFWANIEVEKPAIYSNPPEPVVVTKFKDRRPVYQAAAEMLERCTTVAFDLAHINDLMLAVRDDVVLIGRGVAWCRYESGGKGSYYDYEKVCIDFKNRRDFLHSVSRSWAEVTWVAAASYLTRSEARDRFRPYSGDAYQDAEYKVDKESNEIGGADKRERAKFWEIWHKGEKRVVWVAKGVEDILDEDDPHLDLRDFFPCPKPAYGTVQRGSLVPVPDVMQYKDQLDELNSLTTRIHAIAECLQVRGFYPSGSTEIGEAVQAAMANQSPGRVLVPISNWAAFGGTSEIIVWMPIDDISQTLTQLVSTRQQIIQDIYQIMGLSDLMRGATDPRETLGAQDLKAQYGSSRVRDKQGELVRLARDLVEICGEIIFQKFDDDTIVEMSQTQLPTKQMVEKQLREIADQVDKQSQILQLAQQVAQQGPPPGNAPGNSPGNSPPFPGGPQPPPQPDPGKLQQMLQMGQQVIDQGKQAMAEIASKPTLDQVITLLKDQRTKAFVLDIETDSTIQINENEQKQRNAEFIAVLAQVLPQLMQMVQALPQSVTLAGEILKFAVKPYRAGRSLDGSIDKFVQDAEDMADQPRPDDPATAQTKAAVQIEQMKIDYQKQRDQGEQQLKAAELKMKDDHAKLKVQADTAVGMAKVQATQQESAADAQEANLAAMHDRETHQADMIAKGADILADRQKANIALQTAAMKQRDMQARADERRAMQQFKMMNPPQRQGGFPGG
jgi:hypothetical protein